MKSEKRLLYKVAEKGSGVIHTDKDNYDPEFELWSMAYAALAARREGAVGTTESRSTGSFLNAVINNPENDQFNEIARKVEDQGKLDAIRHELAVAISRSEGGKKRADRKAMYKSLVPSDYHPDLTSNKERFELYKAGNDGYAAPVDSLSPKKYVMACKQNPWQRIKQLASEMLATVPDFFASIRNAFYFLGTGREYVS